MPHHLLHDLITQVFLRSLQYGIVVMGLIDAFVHAHNHHRRNIENLGNFGRTHFMTAITPANAHAFQVTCLTRHMHAVPSQKFRLPSAKAKYPHLANGRTATRERGNDFQGWAIYTDGGTRFADGETLAGWGAFITTEAHLAFAGARVHSNKTAEMSAMIEALSSLGPLGPVARDANSCFFYDSKHAAGVCLGTIQARSHVQLALTCQQSLLKVEHKLRFTMQRVYGHAWNLGDECADLAAALGALGLVSNHNLSTRWTRHSFGSTSCFAACDNLGDVLEKLRDIRTELASTAPKQEIALCSAAGSLRLVCLHHIARDYFSVNSLAQPWWCFEEHHVCHGKFIFVCFYRLQFR